MNEFKSGLVFGAGAYICWGFFPLYWTLLEPAGPIEILANRVVWSLVFVILLATFVRRWPRIRSILRSTKNVLYIAGAAIVITINWGMFIYGVNSGHVIETSLGYFINPLMTVFLGVIVLHERLRKLQWLAVAIGAIAVIILTIDYGRPPFIALTLATSFALYGLIKKQVNLGTVEGLTLETAFIAPIALGFIAYLNATQTATVGHNGLGHFVLVACAGIITAIPLLLFGAAATRLPMTTIGMLQYFAPILQFAFGLLVFHEPMTQVKWLGFILVWSALVAFTWDGLRHRRRYLARSAEGAAL